MSADELFNKLGMIKILDNDDTVIYRLKDDYKDNVVTFDKKLKTINYQCAIFIFENQATWEEMNKTHKFRDDFDKHCSKYGYWGSFPNEIGMKLLQTINKKVEELRMDKELNEAIEELKSMKGPYTYSDCEVCDEDCDKCIKNKAIDTVLNRLKEYENQLDLDYVDENYIPKKKVLKKIELLNNLQLETMENKLQRDSAVKSLYELLEDK